MLNQTAVNIIEGAFIIILLLWSIFQYARFKKMFRGTHAKDVRSVIAQHGETIEMLKKKNSQNEESIGAILKELAVSKRHVGIVRFNAFNEVGGEQSFAYAELDDRKNGIVIASMHSRDTTRIYAKPIINGKSQFHLSAEEEEAIKRAMAKSI